MAESLEVEEMPSPSPLQESPCTSSTKKKNQSKRKQEEDESDEDEPGQDQKGGSTAVDGYRDELAALVALTQRPERIATMSGEEMYDFVSANTTGRTVRLRLAKAFFENLDERSKEAKFTNSPALPGFLEVSRNKKGHFQLLRKDRGKAAFEKQRAAFVFWDLKHSDFPVVEECFRSACEKGIAAFKPIVAKADEAALKATSRAATLSERARVAYLVRHPQAFALMKEVYDPTQKDKRAVLDSKPLRSNADLWVELAGIINDDTWTPQLSEPPSTLPKILQERGFKQINPDSVPEPPMTGVQAQAIFTSFRTPYTVCYDNFNSSGKMEQDLDFASGDLEFKNKYTGEDIFMYYLHLVWEREPPAFCTRLNPPNMRREYGEKGASGAKNERAGSKKRKDAADKDIEPSFTATIGTAIEKVLACLAAPPPSAAPSTEQVEAIRQETAATELATKIDSVRASISTLTETLKSVPPGSVAAEKIADNIARLSDELLSLLCAPKDME